MAIRVNSYHSTRENRKGGGISIFVDKNVQSNLLFEIHDQFNNYLSVRIPRLKSSIIGIYNSNNPENNIEVFLQNFASILEDNKNALILGDFNIDLTLHSRIATAYTELIDQNGYKILNELTQDHNMLLLDVFHPDINSEYKNCKSKYIKFDKVQKDIIENDLDSLNDFYNLINSIINKHSAEFVLKPKKTIEKALHNTRHT